MLQLSGITLAYIGDSIFEVKVREYLIEKGLTKVDDLHKSAIKYVSAVGQSEAFDLIEEKLTEKEMSIFKRGRNAESSRKPRNTSLAIYKKATGFEALIGHLHLSKDFDRLDELYTIIFNN
ncbi:MAG: Mini-ribonuclease 3 [Candidatus Izimaplasma bacterium HR2]|nr:MAG: Mini-ribonuclease 3 [Candidatus Izimaplasma bacterium HR2]